MFFRRNGRTDPREAAWQEQAASLGLSLCEDGQELLEPFLDLSSTPVASGVYRATETGGLQLFTFDLLSDDRSPGRHELAAACLLVADREFCPVPMRVERQLRSQLADIQAGASQAQVVHTGAADGFDERVTVVARDAEAAGRVMRAPVRQAVSRLLERTGQTPVVTMNSRQLLAQVKADQFELAGLGNLLADMLSLYVAVSSDPAS